MVPIEVEHVGRRSSFDGNHPVVAWLVGMDIRKHGLNQDDMDILMGWVSQGHLGWVVIPAVEN